MTPIAEVRIPVELDRDARTGAYLPRSLVFNVNTMAAYEEKTGKFYWDTVLKFSEIQGKYGYRLETGETVPSQAEMRRSSTDIIRRIRVADIHAMLWAALHTYDAQDNPKWPLTLAQIGRLIMPFDTAKFLGLILKGIQANSPTNAELGEVSGGPTLVKPAEPPTTQEESGGEASIELPASAFA